MKTFFLIFSLLLAGCASRNQIAEEFKSIEIGMIKSEVLSVAGPPRWSDREDGVDRWFYYLEPEAKSSERVVYFENNKVVRKGLRKKPLLTAEEMEQIKNPTKPYRHKRSVTDEELRKIIKKEIKKQDPQPDENFEKI